MKMIDMKQIELNRGFVKKVILIAVCVLMGMISFFGISKTASNPETYAKTIESLDEKKTAVAGLTAAAASASSALAAVPGDATTPVANQVIQMSSYLFIVICILVLEKSLLTVMGILSFKVFIPAACVLLAAYFGLKQKMFKAWAVKLVTLGVVLVMIIPTSQKISDLIYEVNRETVEQATEMAEETEESDKDKKDSKKDESWLDSMVSKVKDGVSDAGKMANRILSNFIDAIAVFIITYCVIPILVIIAVTWLVKFIFSLNVDVKIPKMPKWNPYGRKNNRNKLK